MTLSNIDTFEHDIEHELKSKEVTARTIATSRSDIGNEQPVAPPPKPVLLYVAIGVFSLAFLLVGGYFGYTYYMEEQRAQAAVQQQAQLPVAPTTNQLLAELSPSFPDAFGRYVSKVEKKDGGFIVAITSYSPVFSFMIKNESIFADDLAQELGVEKGTKDDLVGIAPVTIVNVIPTTTIPIVLPEIEVVATTSTQPKKTTPVKPTTKTPPTKTTTKTGTSTASTTQTTASTTTMPTSTPVVMTEATPTEAVKKDMTPLPFVFSDMTLSNQNIRVAQSGKHYFYYAFIQNRAVVFSTSADGIIKLRDAILR